MSSANHPELGVIILGAGASKRMGRPKLLLPWGNTTVVGQIISTWRELGVSQIGVVMRSDDAALAEELDRLDFPKSDRIENPQPEQGMFSSVQCAVNWSGWRTNISHWALVLGDQPHLPLQLLRSLLVFHVQNLDKICQPKSEGHSGHPVILPKQIFERLKTTPAATLKDFLKLMASSCVQFEITDPSLLLDLDTPEDYIRLQFR